jgi:hypothetical protein
MFGLKHAARAALLLAVAACAGDVTAPTAAGEGGPVQTISDAAHAGAVPGYYFLPPMVPSPSYSGTFDGGLQPTVEICELAGPVCGPVIAQYTTTSGTGGALVQVGTSAYQVNWHTNQFNLDPAKTYRISVYVDAFQLGFADVDVVNSGKELKNVDTQQFIPLQDGRTLPIKFRIETGIAGQVIVTPDSASIPVGGTQQFTATVLDLHGNPLAASVSWSSSNPGVATVDASGLATGLSVGQTTITATSQAASGSATLVVFNPNTPPVAHADTFQAIGNVTVPVAAPGVLANDTDGEGNTLSAVPGTFPTAQGGTVTINADGSFSYLSAAGFTGQDSFEYTVTDGIDSATATVTVVSAYRVWYVDNSAAAPGDGRDASPFTTLKAAESASAAGETIFLLHGNGTTAGYDEGIVLKTGQSLTGQGVPANVTATLNGQTVVLLAAGSAPTVTRTSAGTTVQISTNNVIQGFDVESTAGAGIAGTGFGTLTVGSMSVDATGGPALDLSSGDVFGAFEALSSSGSAGAGIHLLGIGGSFSAAEGTITGAATAGVDVTGGDGVFSYGGDVVATGPLAVFVANRTGGALTFGGTIASTGSGIGVQNNSGGTIAFTGSSKTLSTGANAGVRLLNNAGATISFAGGGLVIATTSGTGFEATGGGTVTVTGAGNTVVSAGGTAVQVENTTIGAAGLSFRSVSASGGSNGIVLNNTGALNGLQVTGTGSAGSGGTISGVTGADGGTAGNGVYLSDVRNVQLSYMTLSGSDNFAIRGVDVNGFALENSVVSGTHGNNAALGEGAIFFTGLTGAASFDGSQVSGGLTDNLAVANASGVLNRLSIAGATIGQNGMATGDDGVSIEATGTAVVNVTVQSSTFIGARADLFELALSGSAAADLVFASNTLNNGHAAPLSGGGGVLVSSTGGSPTLTYAVTGNTVRNTTGAALAVIKGAGDGTFTGSVSGNQVGQSGVANSGSSQGSGIVVDLIGGGSHTASVVGNQVFQFTNFGIRAQAGNTTSGGQGVLNVTVQGNTVAQPSANAVASFFPTHGIRIQSGVATGDNAIVCATVGGAGALANSVTGTGINGGADIRLFERFLTTMALPGYAGAPNDNAAAAAFAQANNGGTPTVQATNNVSAGGPGFVGTCPA